MMLWAIVTPICQHHNNMLYWYSIFVDTAVYTYLIINSHICYYLLYKCIFCEDKKRSNVSMDYDKLINCKWALFYDYAKYCITLMSQGAKNVEQVENDKRRYKTDFVDLHCESLTLKGSFSLKHFLILPHTKSNHAGYLTQTIYQRKIEPQTKHNLWEW